MTSILLASLFAGLVAVAVTVAVERFGGLIGGLLGTLPSTIVPAALGIYGVADIAAFTTAMYAVAPGMFLNVLFLLIWGVLPARLPPRRGWQLGVTLVVSLGFWLAGALGLTLFLGDQVTLWSAVAICAAMVVAGLAATSRSPAAPVAMKRVRPAVLVLRGSAAAIAIGVAVVIASQGGDVAAGVASVFPAIFLTTMVSLWLSHGADVPSGAVGPMMVGSTAVVSYALIAVLLFPLFGPAWGAAVTWLIVAVVVQAPLFFAVRAVARRAQGPTRSR